MKHIRKPAVLLTAILTPITLIWLLAMSIVNCQGKSTEYDYNSPEHVEATHWLDN